MFTENNKTDISDAHNIILHPSKMGFDLSTMYSRIKKFTQESVLDHACQATAYSNYVYSVQTENGEYLYKEYADKKAEDCKNNEVEIQLQIGFPKILYLGDGFRIEPYYKHTTIDFSNDLLKIAMALRGLHQTKVQCNIDQGNMFDSMLHKSSQLSNEKKIQEIANTFKEVLAKNELYLCHNDLQIGNMLKIDGEIKFIDFEYACMGSIYFDIANLFCETMCDYSADSVLVRSRGYTVEAKKNFLRKYFEKEEIETEFARVHEMEGYCHFFWFLWALSSSKDGPSASFDYKAHAKSRLDHLVELNFLKSDDAKHIQSNYLHE